MTIDQNTFDVLIIGGGVVGATLALALSHQPLNIGVIEANPISPDAPTHRDERAIALTNGSVRIFQSLNVWEKIKPQATPIKQIHVSDAGHFGRTKFVASNLGYPSFGHVVFAYQLADTLQAQLLNSSTVTTIEAKLTQLVRDDKGYTVHIQTPSRTQVLSTRLLIAADGVHSLTRKLLNIPVKHLDHHQNAIVTTIEVSKPNEGIAYERFVSSGPLAALPIADHRYVIIWTMDTREVDVLMRLSDETFCEKLQSIWGYRLGRVLSIEKRHTFLLRSTFSEQQVCPSAILMGNAAHTLHPVAAQGLNLSLKDVAVFVEMVQEAISNGEDPARYALLETYAASRKKEQALVSGFTNSLIHLFSTEIPPVVLARNIGLSSLNMLPFAQKTFAKRAMGLAGRLPRLML